MKPYHLLKQSLLIAALAFTSTVHAQDDEKLDQILELLGTIKAEQETQAADIGELKKYHASPADTAEKSAEEPKEKTASEEITRDGGFIASVHPAQNGQEQAALGRMVVDGFPMQQSVGNKKFKLGEDELAYHSSGELLIKEDGLHSFSIRTTENSSTFRCAFSFEIQGQPVLNVKRMRKSTHSASVNLTKGWYDFTMYQNCQLSGILWHFNILEPSALDPVPLTSSYLFRRK